MKPSESRGGVLATALVLLLMPAAYIGSYAALVDRQFMGRGWNDLRPRPAYRYIDCAAAQVAFRPLHEIDRHVRADYWDATILVY